MEKEKTPLVQDGVNYEQLANDALFRGEKTYFEDDDESYDESNDDLPEEPETAEKATEPDPVNSPADEKKDSMNNVDSGKESSETSETKESSLVGTPESKKTEMASNEVKMIDVHFLFPEDMYGIIKASAHYEHKTVSNFLIDNLSPEFKKRAEVLKSIFPKK